MLKVLDIRKVLDLTYGIGSFYASCPDLEIIAVDVVKREWQIAPKEFHKADALDFIVSFNERVDAVVLDPPLDTRPTARRAELRDVLYSNKFPFTKIIRVIKEARKKAEYVVLKYMPSTEEEIELLRLSPLHVIT